MPVAAALTNLQAAKSAQCDSLIAKRTSLGFGRASRCFRFGSRTDYRRGIFEPVCRMGRVSGKHHQSLHGWGFDTSGAVPVRYAVPPKCGSGKRWSLALVDISTTRTMTTSVVWLQCTLILDIRSNLIWHQFRQTWPTFDDAKRLRASLIYNTNCTPKH